MIQSNREPHQVQPGDRLIQIGDDPIGKQDGPATSRGLLIEQSVSLLDETDTPMQVLTVWWSQSSPHPRSWMMEIRIPHFESPTLVVIHH